MRTDEKTVVAVDVGTTKICTIVARESKTSGLKVLAHNTIPCKGLIKGNVADIPVTEKAINESIQMAQQAAGIRISSAFVGITGAHIGFENKKEKLKSINRAGVIVADELNNPVATKTSYPNQRGRKLIHAIRMSFSVDGQSGIKNPVGMHSSQVEAETHLITADTSFINKLVLAVENIGIKVSGLVLEPLASGLAVLSPKEKMEGAVLVDIGGGTTDIVGFRRGRICHTGVIPIGGHQFTNDIAATYDTSYEVAEEVKLQHGSAYKTSPNEDQDVSILLKDQESILKVRKQEISQLMSSRAIELAELIGKEIGGINLGKKSDVRLVLTGGASKLHGLKSIVQNTVNMHVRDGLPDLEGTIPQEIRSPTHATALGIALWALNRNNPISEESNFIGDIDVQFEKESLLGKLVNLMNRLMPVNQLASSRKWRV